MPGGSYYGLKRTDKYRFIYRWDTDLWLSVLTLCFILRTRLWETWVSETGRRSSVMYHTLSIGALPHQKKNHIGRQWKQVNTTHIYVVGVWRQATVNITGRKKDTRRSGITTLRLFTPSSKALPNKSFSYEGCCEALCVSLSVFDCNCCNVLFLPTATDTNVFWKDNKRKVQITVRLKLFQHHISLHCCGAVMTWNSHFQPDKQGCGCVGTCT